MGRNIAFCCEFGQMSCLRAFRGLPRLLWYHTGEVIQFITKLHLLGNMYFVIYGCPFKLLWLPEHLQTYSSYRKSHASWTGLFQKLAFFCFAPSFSPTRMNLCHVLFFDLLITNIFHHTYISYYMALVDLGCPGLPRARAPQPPWTGVDPGMWAERQLISPLTHLFLHNNNTLQIC